MADFLTPDDLIAAGQQVLRTELDPDGRGIVDLQPGSDLTTLISMGAGMLTPLLAHHADRVAARTLSGAAGSDLRELALDVWQTQPRTAAPARGTLYLQRLSAVAATSIPLGNRFGVPPADGQPGVLFEAASEVPAAIGTTAVAVPIRCTIDGSSGNVRRDLITQIVDRLPDPTWVIYQPIGGDPVLEGEPNPDPVGGGMDDETDEALKARLRASPRDAAQRPGTEDGIDFGIRETSGVAEVVLIEPGDGTVVAFVGDENLNLPAAMESDILARLPTFRGFGVPVAVRAFDVQDVAVDVTIYRDQQLDQYDLDTDRAAVLAALLDYFALTRSRPDEYTRDGMRLAIGRVIEGVQAITFVAPVADVVRQDNASYGAVTALTRYTTDEANVVIQFAAPQTS